MIVVSLCILFKFYINDCTNRESFIDNYIASNCQGRILSAYHDFGSITGLSQQYYNVLRFMNDYLEVA